MLDLRYYQQEAVNSVYAYMRAKPDTNCCAVLPTGAGKSIVIAKIVSDAVTLWGGRVAILAHVKELLEQNAAKVAALCPEIQIGMYSAGLGRRDTDNQVVVAGIQSVYNKADELGAFDLILIDEAHLIPPDGDGMYQTFLTAEKAINSNVRLIGFTATPYRLRGGLICKPENLLNDICYEIGVRELIMRGYLSKLRSKNGRTKADLADLHIRAGEFIAEEIADKMDNERLVAAACSEIIEITRERKKVLIFASSVAHAEHIKQQLELRSGSECGLVIGDTPKQERAEILDRFKGIPVAADLFGNTKTEIKYLVNVGVLTTGFDAPNIDCVVLLRPTNSAGLYYQMVGRGFRLSPETGKEDCMILDYGGNIMRHGPVDCIRVEEAAGGRKKGAPPMRECPKCLAVFPAGRTKCPDCGFEMPREEGKLHHGTRAASDGILSDQSSETEFDVRRVLYNKHYKRFAGPEAPPTLRVEYEIGFNDYISDWICPEHSGYARRKSEKWWFERAGFELPATVDECLAYADAGKLREPTAITVKRVPGSDWPTITRYELAEYTRADKEDADSARCGDPDCLPGNLPKDFHTEAECLQYAKSRIAAIRAEMAATGNWISLDCDPGDIAERLAIMQAEEPMKNAFMRGPDFNESFDSSAVAEKHRTEMAAGVGMSREEYERILAEDDIPF
ncbi:MAG: DNA helicase [Clostridiales bacterium]|nr:MAG: DNA helicase [Clostridiales bacterium]